MSWKHRHLIGIEPLDRTDIETVIQVAQSFRQILGRSVKKVPALRGKTVVNLFLEPSTRTRVAFEMAAKRLSADVVTITSSASSLVKGETLRDTVQNIEALNADILVIRHSAAGSSYYLSQFAQIPIINAGDGAHEHPTQALLDCMTLMDRFGSLDGIKVTILGDILFSRVARSNIWTLTKMGAQVTLVGPSTLVPPHFAKWGVKVSHDLQTSLRDADAVMLLRIQHERQSSSHFPSLGEYTSMFGLNKRRASWLKPGAIIMHPGPINRGVEIDSDLADSDQSVILQQVTNGIAIRMAVLYLCSGGQPDNVTVADTDKEGVR
jgi:aspartate carbamoyltransferase catalytic subunit